MNCNISSSLFNEKFIQNVSQLNEKKEQLQALQESKQQDPVTEENAAQVDNNTEKVDKMIDKDDDSQESQTSSLHADTSFDEKITEPMQAKSFAYFLQEKSDAIQALPPQFRLITAEVVAYLSLQKPLPKTLQHRLSWIKEQTLNFSNNSLCPSSIHCLLSGLCSRHQNEDQWDSQVRAFIKKKFGSFLQDFFKTQDPCTNNKKSPSNSSDQKYRLS